MEERLGVADGIRSTSGHRHGDQPSKAQEGRALDEHIF